MIIKSPWHDFYDGVAASDREPDPIYIRKTAWHGFRRWPFPSFDPTWYGTRFIRSTRAIGFAGKVYPLISVGLPGEEGFHRCFTLGEVDRVLDDIRGYRSVGVRSYMKPQRPGYVQFFNDWAARADNYVGLFHEFNCPIFLVTDRFYASVLDGNYHLPLSESGHVESGLYANPYLRAWDFARVLDPYAAYQELRMYLSGLAAPHRPIPPVSDEDMVEAKGFDPRYSFRKPPSK